MELKKYILLNESANNILLRKKDLGDITETEIKEKKAYVFSSKKYFFDTFFEFSIRATSNNVFMLLTEYDDMLVFIDQDHDERRETFLKYYEEDGTLKTTSGQYSFDYIFKNLESLLIQDHVGNFIRYDLSHGEFENALN